VEVALDKPLRARVAGAEEAADLFGVLADHAIAKLKDVHLLPAASSATLPEERGRRPAPASKRRAAWFPWQLNG
jgi:hypothetical protein